MFIFDTDALTHLHKGNAKILDRLKQAGTNQFAITIVTKAEILRGRIDFLLKASDGTALERAQRFFIESENLLAQLSVIGFTPDSVAKFEELRQNAKYRKIGRNDLLIASICLVNRALLVTRNTKHFEQFQHLQVEN